MARSQVTYRIPPPVSQGTNHRFTLPSQSKSDNNAISFVSDPLLPSPLSNLPPSVKLRILQIAAQQDAHFRSRATGYRNTNGVLHRQSRLYSKTLLSLSLVNKEFASLAQPLFFKEIKRIDKCGQPIFTLGIAHRYSQHVQCVDLSIRDRMRHNYDDPPNTPDALLSFLPLFVNLSEITFDSQVLQEILPRAANPEAQTFAARRGCIMSIGGQVTTLRVTGMSHKVSSILDDFPRLKHLELVDLPLKEEKALGPRLPELSLFGGPATEEQKEAKAKKEERKRAMEEEKEKEEKEKKDLEERALLDAIVSKEDLDFLEVRQTRKKKVYAYGIHSPSPNQPPVLPLNWIRSTWPQLKHISLSGPRIVQSDLDFVAMFKNTLETLVVRQTMNQRTITETPSLPNLPHLKSLTLAAPHPVELCRFLRLSLPLRTNSDDDTPLNDPLHYPLLTSLSLDGVPDSSRFESVLSFILTHSSTLRTLDCFELSDPLNSSSIASSLSHPSLSNVHIRTSAYPANSFPNDAFKIAQPAFDDSDGPDDEDELLLREPTSEELEEMIDKALSYGESRIEEATKALEKDGTVKDLFALAGLYKDLDSERVAKFG